MDSCNGVDQVAVYELVPPATSIGTSSPCELLIIPPISGFFAPLRERIERFGAIVATNFKCVRIVEFAGQNDRTGFFSVVKSGQQLTSFLNGDAGQSFTVFGLCSGATASVYAAAKVRNVTDIFAWEMSPRYRYDRAHRRFYERRFSLAVCDSTFLVPVQPADFVATLDCRLAFAHGCPSVSCSEMGQRELLALAKKGAYFSLEGVSHFLDGPGAIDKLAEAFERWFIDRSPRAGDDTSS